MKPTDDHSNNPEERSFDLELDRFLGATPVSASRGYSDKVCRNVTARASGIDRVMRGSVYGIAAAVVLSLIAWFGFTPTEEPNVIGMHKNGNEFYTEVHMLEDMLHGAEALGNEDVLDTLELLLGG